MGRAGSKPLIFMYHGLFLGHQHEIWSKQHNGKVRLLRWMREKKLVALTNEEIKEMCENQLWEDTVRDMGF